MHAEALDHIRAGRPVEAAESMQALADLLEPMWQGYAAYGLEYDLNAATAFWIYHLTVGARIIRMLDPELRAAAVSPDEEIRLTATRLPHSIARSALRHRAAGSIRDGLAPLLSVYDAVIGDLTGGGRQQLPATGLARRRTGAPFRTLLSFTLSDLQREIGRAEYLTAGPGASAETTGLVAAEFAAVQLRAAHQQLLVMLRRAVQVRDITTLREVLPKWTMPDTSLVRDALWESSSRFYVSGRPPDGQEPPGGLCPQSTPGGPGPGSGSRARRRGESPARAALRASSRAGAQRTDGGIVAGPCGLVLPAGPGLVPESLAEV
jgi:hypothetical protein